MATWVIFNIHHSSHVNAWCYFRDRNKNGPRIVDHRFHNLTPNRREEDEVYFQRTTPRIPSNRNRFDSIGDDPGRYDSSSREPLARIAFGKLPYPAGNSELNRRTWIKINVIMSKQCDMWRCHDKIKFKEYDSFQQSLIFIFLY